MDQFLQTESWARFQESAGRKFICTESGVYGFVHTLPLVGSYLYFPKYPWKDISNFKFQISQILTEARKRNISWIRVEPENESLLVELKEAYGKSLVKAPHDMQPRENLVIDITASEEELMMDMKSKVRYNIRLAEKKGVRILVTRDQSYQEVFFGVIEATAKRQGILAHSRSYYEKMFTVFPEEELTLYVAEYKGKVLAANLVLFSGDTATYLHGGTSDEYREAMAPFLLQWEQIREAKRRGCQWYDFGGVKTENSQQPTKNGEQKQENSWAGITRFKMGFSPATVPIVYPGCYDIILDAKKYWLYNRLRYLQIGLSVFRKFLKR